MEYQRIVLGIGNPGAEYANTRHNAGFLVLDRYAAAVGTTFRRLERRKSEWFGPDGKKFGGKVKAHVASFETPGVEGRTLLVQPLTYVNLSGDVAGPLLRAAGLGPESLFVVVDDLNLPLGRIRVRPSGSAGGHNGLKSIEATLTTNAYPRLRLGIGLPDGIDLASSIDAFGSHGEQVDFVLAPFAPPEREVLASVLDRSVQVLDEWIRLDPRAEDHAAAFEALMGRHNSFRGSSDPAS